MARHNKRLPCPVCGKVTGSRWQHLQRLHPEWLAAEAEADAAYLTQASKAFVTAMAQIQRQEASDGN